ncbi:MAG: phosphoribosylaminoimidazolesuccinocarboxamide synthase [Actinomycetota bacterium]|nr:phosphoribosylaminoimidazolesuccinocarboxamide synthase [Actinomycetota bacterium]
MAEPEPFLRSDVAFLGEPVVGKVRDVYRHGEDLVIVTTDRLSGFDRVLGGVPHKGQVLNQLSEWWFAQLEDVCASHLIAVPDPNVTVAVDCRPIPLELVVRGYLTGVTDTSIWTRYERGERDFGGTTLPDGLAHNARLPTPLVTPTTKAPAGHHDENLDHDEVTGRGLLDAATWDRVREIALGLFERGQDLAREGGLVLVDTKYELGVTPEGELVVIDEVHTPDSSRFWTTASLEAGEPENLDKEVVRRWYAAQGYRGDGDPPPMAPELVADMSRRYVSVYERLTGKAFEPAAQPAGPRIAAALRDWAS